MIKKRKPKYIRVQTYGKTSRGTILLTAREYKNARARYKRAKT